MAIELPNVDELIPVTVQALQLLGGSASNSEIHDKVVEVLKLPPALVDLVHKEGSSDTRLDYRLRWSRTYLKKVGAVDNNQPAVWTLTARGRSMSEEELAHVRKIVRAAEKIASVTAPEVNEVVEVAELAQDEELAWTEKLLSVLLSMKPDAFERLCQRILRESGFTKVEVTGKSGDGGIDGNGVLRMKLVSFHVLFQCKRRKDTVGSSVVRDFRGAMVGRADKGLIMTTGRFTAEARKEATRDGAPAIDLVDGDDLCQLLRELKIGVRTKIVEEVEIDEAVLAAI
jgi:restriction system protein